MAPTRRSVARATQWRTPTHGRKIKEIGGMGDLREGRLRESLVALLLLSFPLVRPLPLPPWSPHRSLRPTYRNLGVVDARPQAEREFALMGLLLCIRGNHVPPRRLPLDEDDVAFVFEDTLTLLLLVSFLSSPGSRSLFLVRPLPLPPSVPSPHSSADIPQPNLSGRLLPP
ncbi:hypothetical protein K438DRAFT_1999250 [Mycena galopus ATCC 62051]|nr:hypothetical protein K438DRAFT_1999250 [Mycena galopus ATCC 62051]